MGMRHRVVVELALSHEEHDLTSLRAETTVMQVRAAEHEEPILAALREVQALGARWTADNGYGGLEQNGVFVDDETFEVPAASRHGPGRVRVTVDLKQIVAGGAADEVAEPFKALNEATRRSQVLASTKTGPYLFC